jgi:hypothetical protein
MTILILLYLGTLFPIYFLAKVLRHTVHRWLIVFLHSLWLLFLAVSCSTEAPVFLSEESDGLGVIEGFSGGRTSATLKQYIGDENLVFIDVSDNIQLLDDVFRNAADTSQLIVTDRLKLTELLNWLAKDSTVYRLYDQLVLDILINQAYQDPAVDSALRQSLTNSVFADKLLLANSQINSLPDEIAFPSDDLPTYSVDMEKYNDVFFNYSLMRSDGCGSPLTATLPYEWYLRYTNRKSSTFEFPVIGTILKETDSNTGTVSWGLGTFIPNLKLRDNDINYPVSGNQLSLWEKLLSSLSLGQHESGGLRRSESPVQVMKLGFLLRAGKQVFTQKLQAAKDAGKRTTIIIGAVSDKASDIHNTAYGNMHGTVLLTNVFLNLQNGGHLITLGYAAFLWIAFLVISHSVFSRNIEKDHDGMYILYTEIKSYLVPAGVTRLAAAIHEKWASVVRKGKNALSNTLPKSSVWMTSGFVSFKEQLYKIANKLIFSKKHYWLLLLLLWISVVYYNKVLNIMGLGVYLFAIDFTLSLFKKKPTDLKR